MTSQAEIFRTLLLLSGSPLTILFAAAHAAALGQTADLRFLKRAAGLSDKTTNQVLQTLEQIGMMTRQGSAWVLSADGLSAVRLLGQIEPAPSAPAPRPQEVVRSESNRGQPASGRKFSGEENSDHLESTRKNLVKSSSGTSGSSSLTISDSEHDSVLPPPLDSRDESNRKNSEKARVLLNLAMCDRYQIREPARSRLAKRDYVSPEMIQGHCETAKDIALAIFRIEHNWDVPNDPSGDPP